jgi:hypothetical protein
MRFRQGFSVGVISAALSGVHAAVPPGVIVVHNPLLAIHPPPAGPAVPPAPPANQAELDVVLNQWVARVVDEDGLAKMTPTLGAYWDVATEQIRPNIFLPAGAPGGAVAQDEDFVLPPLYRSGATVVFTLQNHPAWVIKYHRHCDGGLTDPIDSTVVEAYFLRELHVRLPGYTHRLLYYSASVNEPGIEGKLEGVGANCANGLRPLVRFMITEQVGISLATYSDAQGMVPVTTAAKLGIQMIRLLQQLHDLNFIHGDGHYGNYAVHGGDLILIDFGRSRLIDPATSFPDGEDTYMPGIVPPAPGVRGRVWCHIFLTQWESRYRKPSYRDDVYRALINVTILIHNANYRPHMGTHCTGIRNAPDVPSRNAREDDYLDYKTNRNMFHGQVLPAVDVSLIDRVAGTPLAAHAADVIASFQGTLDILRATPIHARPDYDGIVAALERIVLFTEPAPVNTHVAF